MVAERIGAANLHSCGSPGLLDGGHFAGEPAPRLGGDTVDVLTAALGLTPADISRLTDAKTIAH